MMFRANHINYQSQTQILTINPIIRDNFDGSNAPDDFKKIINKFFEIEDIGTYTESAKDRTYEQILKFSLDNLEKAKRKELLDWCKKFGTD